MKLFDNFFVNIGIKSFCFLFVVYSFMIFSFYWGNHDWLYLKNGISLLDNLFEARFSLHFFSVLFFDGMILPVLLQLLALVGIVFLSLVSGVYLGVPQKNRQFLLYVLLLGVFPYNFIVFYYQYTAVSLFWWAFVGVLLLMLVEKQCCWWRFCLGVMGWMLLLGSYPPIIAFILVLFIAKQIILYVYEKRDFRKVVLKSGYFAIQLILGYFLFDFVFRKLGGEVFFKVKMYNVRVNGIDVILSKIPFEILRLFRSLFDLRAELGVSGSLFLFVLLIGGSALCFGDAKNKFIIFVMLFALCLATRFMFLVSSEGGLAYFRGGYWGILGIVVFALAIFSMSDKKWIENIFYVFSILFLVIFVRIDFEAQKTMSFIFKSEMNLHERMRQRIEGHEKFDKNSSYATLSLGGSESNGHFCVEGCNGYRSEILAAIAMNMDLVSLLFFDDDDYLVGKKFGAWGGRIWDIHDNKYFASKKNKLRDLVKKDWKNISGWLFVDAKKWPNKNGIYVDDRHIFILLNNNYKQFYRDGLFYFFGDKEMIF